MEDFVGEPAFAIAFASALKTNIALEELTICDLSARDKREFNELITRWNGGLRTLNDEQLEIPEPETWNPWKKVATKAARLETRAGMGRLLERVRAAREYQEVRQDQDYRDLLVSLQGRWEQLPADESDDDYSTDGEESSQDDDDDNSRESERKRKTTCKCSNCF